MADGEGEAVGGGFGGYGDEMDFGCGGEVGEGGGG